MDRRIRHCMYGLLCLLLFTSVEGRTQPTKSILYVNGTAHLGNGKVIEKSIVGIENGKIKQVFNANVVDYTNLTYDTVIQIDGKHLYPGFIAANSVLGLTEIQAVRASNDIDEVGEINPHIRSLVAYNAESKVTATVRSNGVLLAQVTPRGGLISGTSSIVKTDGWNWEDAAYKTDDGIHLNWPAKVDESHKKAKELTAKRAEKLVRLRQFFDEADAYRKASYQYERNLKYEAMRGLLEGKKTLYLHVNFVKEITEAIYFSRRYNLGKVVIVGGYDAWRIPELLNDNHVAVILRRVHSLPSREDDAIDLPYKLPALLEKAGVLFCLDVAGGMEAMQSRNLPFYAGTAAAYGLEKEAAVRSITLNAAKILGIAETTGSLEEGKDATFFISSGDALDMRTNDVEMAYIKGEAVNLGNHQKDLYQKYRQKYQH